MNKRLKDNILIETNFRFWLILILVKLCCLFPESTKGQAGNFPINDSLRVVISQNTGTEKISAQIELALKIQENEEEALELANAALESAIEINDRILELRAYYTFGRIYSTHNKHEASEAYYNRALKISDEIGENWYKGEILFRMGVVDHRNGDSRQALDYFSRSIQVSRLAENYKAAAAAYSMMGTIFRLSGLYDRAIEYILKSKLNYEMANFSEGDAWAAYLIGRIYADLKLSEEALEYFREALEKYKLMAAKDGNFNGVSICYEQIGMIYLESGKLEEARQNINNVLDIHKQSNSDYGISNAYKNLGKIEYYSGNFDKAESYLNDALVIKERINDLLSLPSIYEYKGLCKIEEGNTIEGIKDIEQALELALSNDQVKMQLEIYSNLEDVYAELNDFEKVIFYQNKQIETQDIILSDGANVKIDQLQAIYELEEKNNQIASLEKQNEINRIRLKQQRTYQILIISGFLFVLIIAIVIILLYRKIRKNNQELSKINKTKDRLFSIIAHDLKGSLGSSLALSKIVAEEDEENKKSPDRNYSMLMFQSLSSSYNLLNNLLDWARSQFQKMEFNPKQLLLKNMLNDVGKQLSTQIQDKNISLEIEPDIAQTVFADEGMLKTILRNLFSNAIKFSSPGGKIIISSLVQDGFTQVSVKDYGVGIDSAIIPQLFDLASNNSTSGTLGESGTGLGLILVKEFVEKHGGTIWVESEVSVGSVFNFTLPIAD
jgi:signal transduction histidine kinase/Tfp pilus assembly protein PilF